MKLGIVGLPNVGKTTLFNALTGSRAETGAYTVAGAKPNVGVAKVPDERLDWLAEYYHPKKYSPATIEFVDVPGVAAGGKGNEVFQAIRQVDALVEVVRCFDDESIFLEKADAVRDAESFELELILADIEIVERRLDRAKKNAKSGDKKYKREAEMCEALIAHLEEEKPARDFPFTDEDKDILTDGGLLTVKPVIYAANIAEDQLGLDESELPYVQAVRKAAAQEGAEKAAGLLLGLTAAQKGAEEACGGGGLEVAACAAGAQGTAEQRPEQAVVGIVSAVERIGKNACEDRSHQVAAR